MNSLRPQQRHQQPAQARRRPSTNLWAARRHVAACSHQHSSNGHAEQQEAPKSTRRRRLVLGIESSCDDTGVAVVSSDGEVLGEALATQAEIHAPWGGVVPNLAMEAHKAAIDRVVEQALQRANVTLDDVDAVAVTVGPGLSLCLRVGTVKAMQLAAAHRKPLVRVHHMEAHALVARMLPADDPHRPQFPFLCLLVSGGHNLLVLVRGVGHYVQLGSTLDDALGEAYDKVARLLGLDLRPSGGAALEVLARHGNPTAFKFVVPMRKHANCDFSYAGLKTSVRLAIEQRLGAVAGAAQAAQAPATELELGSGSSAASGKGGGEAAASVGQETPPQARDEAREQVKADIAASFQHVATVHLLERVERGMAWAKETEPALKHLVVAGGVACNQHIRAQLAQAAARGGLELVLPPPRWCTDNGAMVAWAGMERLELGFQEAPPPADTQLDEDAWVELRPRWPLTSLKHPRCDLPAPTAKAAKALAAAAATSGAAGAAAGAAAAPPAAAQYGLRSARKARMHTSLTDMTMQELAGRA